jgi:hypothetical protein
MDNDYFQAPPEQVEAEAPAAALDPAAVVEQVRELLFGEHRRATESALKSLEDRFAALTATVEARMADLERRLTESRNEADAARDGHVEAIGTALHELGDRLKGLISRG